MSDDAQIPPTAAAPRTPPRFVPTLTEVIEPNGQPHTAHAASPDPAISNDLASVPAMQRQEANIANDLTRQLLRTDFEEKLAKAVAKAVAAQLVDLEARVDAAVSRAVLEAIENEMGRSGRTS